MNKNIIFIIMTWLFKSIDYEMQPPHDFLHEFASILFTWLHKPRFAQITQLLCVSSQIFIFVQSSHEKGQ